MNRSLRFYIFLLLCGAVVCLAARLVIARFKYNDD